MNEVKFTPVALNSATRNISSTGTQDEVKSDKSLPVDGNELPIEETKKVGSEKIVNELLAREKTEQAVNEVNQFVQSVQRDLHFSVDEDSGLTIIRVRDKESGELIRQIPEDIFLNLAQKLKDTNSIQLLDTHG